MPRKLLPIPRLRKKAWGVFSKWLRQKYADQHGIVLCITCGSKHYWKDIQAGHYHHGASKKSYIHEVNVHPQCVACNKWRDGNASKYAEYLRRHYTLEQIDEIDALSNQIWKPTRDELEAIILKYKE